MASSIHPHRNRRQLHHHSSPSDPSSSKHPNPDTPTLLPPHHQSSNPQNPNTSSTAIEPPIEPSLEDLHLSTSSHLTRQEVLKRRSHNLKQLTRVYRDYYWSMMEEIKGKYREYVWKYGLSPFKDEEGERVKEEEEDTEVGKKKGLEAINNPCVFHGCALKAMALTRFCHLHILSDPKQVLYKPCEYVIKSAQTGPITCGRPILRARIPAFCNVHFQKAQRALKKAGVPIPSSSKLAPKFHVIVAEYVHQIQAKRRAALRANRNAVVVKQESCT